MEKTKDINIKEAGRITTTALLEVTGPEEQGLVPAKITICTTKKNNGANPEKFPLEREFSNGYISKDVVSSLSLLSKKETSGKDFYKVVIQYTNIKGKLPLLVTSAVPITNPTTFGATGGTFEGVGIITSVIKELCQFGKQGASWILRLALSCPNINDWDNPVAHEIIFKGTQEELKAEMADGGLSVGSALAINAPFELYGVESLDATQSSVPTISILCSSWDIVKPDGTLRENLAKIFAIQTQGRRLSEKDLTELTSRKEYTNNAFKSRKSRGAYMNIVKNRFMNMKTMMGDSEEEAIKSIFGQV